MCNVLFVEDVAEGTAAQPHNIGASWGLSRFETDALCHVDDACDPTQG